MSDKVVYSTVKFKNSNYTGPETHADVIYSEVKICGPVPTQRTNCEQNNAVFTEKTTTSALRYRAALMSLALLCAILLIVIIVLGASLNGINADFHAMEEDLAKFKANYSFLVNETVQPQDVFRSLNKYIKWQQEEINNLFKEKAELQERFGNLTKTKEELQESCNNVREEKILLQNNFSILTNDKSRLQENYAILGKDKEQLQNICNIFLKKFDALDQYCPSICEDDYIKQSTSSSTFKNHACNLCPHGWHSFNSKCYYISKYVYITWAQSKKYCTDHGAHLVIIDNEDEKNFINKHITGAYWIGLSRDSQWTSWIWVDGTSLESNRFWQKRQLESWNYNNNCVISDKNVWKNKNCEEKNLYVCETEPLIF